MRTQTIYYNVVAAIMANPIDGTYSIGPEGQLDRVLRTHGAQVGGVNPAYVYEAGDAALLLDNFAGLLRYLRQLKVVENGTDIGVWTDPGTGKTYVEPTEWIEDDDTAIHEAWQRGELAIWSWDAMSVIEIEEVR